MNVMIGLDEYAFRMSNMLMRFGHLGWTIEINPDNNGFIITHRIFYRMPIITLTRIAFMCESYANSLVYANEENWIKPKWQSEITVDRILIRLH